MRKKDMKKMYREKDPPGIHFSFLRKNNIFLS